MKANIRASWDAPQRSWKGQVSIAGIGVVWQDSRVSRDSVIEAAVEWLGRSQWRELPRVFERTSREEFRKLEATFNLRAMGIGQLKAAAAEILKLSAGDAGERREREAFLRAIERELRARGDRLFPKQPNRV
jgi:hypothetical protein